MTVVTKNAVDFANVIYFNQTYQFYWHKISVNVFQWVSMAKNGLMFREHQVSIFVALDGQICSNNYYINSMQQFKERLTLSNQKWC